MSRSVGAACIPSASPSSSIQRKKVAGLCRRSIISIWEVGSSASDHASEAEDADCLNVIRSELDLVLSIRDKLYG